MLPVAWRVKLLQIGAWWNNHHAFRIIVIVESVLLLNFILRAGDHQVGVGQRLLLCIDAARNVVGVLDLIARQPPGQQPFALVPAQRMPRMDEWNSQLVGEPHPNVAGIGIVTVHQLWHAGLVVEPIEQVVREAVKVIPQLLLWKIFVRSGIDADDAHFL